MGSPKSNLRIGSKTILQYMLHNLRPISNTVVVVCASPGTRPNVSEDVIWAYDLVGEQGPLRGLEAGLMALPSGVGKTFVSSCDAPLLRPELVVRLLADSMVGQAVVPMIGGFPQPLTGVYDTNILPTVKEMLKRGDRSLRALLNRLDTHWVSEDDLKQIDPQLLSFENINTPKDYERVLDIFMALS